jgi:hypothetical protein
MTINTTHHIRRLVAVATATLAFGALAGTALGGTASSADGGPSPEPTAQATTAWLAANR